ncbi:MAG: acyltransferase [Lachnospiraceae bacterium]|nr:acyltransferase [Lachnospiraceae bacterium]
MELEKKDTQMTQGVAILTMVIVHLFAKKGADVYGSPLIWVKPGVPLVYYLGFLGGICVPFYCFCTGYALFVQFCSRELKKHIKRTHTRLIKFLIHFWVICIIFSIIGIFFDQYGEVPGNIYRFLGNFFLLEHTYNGAWWFASTYVVFILISPFFLKLAKKVDSRVLFIIFAIIFCAYYICNMMDLFEASPEDYYWKGFLLRKVSDLWYVLFFYVVGMLFAKEKIISRIKQWLDRVAGKKQDVYLLAAVIVVTLGLCVIELSVSMYFFSIFYFICFHVWKKSDKIKRFFLFFGKHSTNIWLVHMFFYLFIFKDLVFVAKYPVFILAFMLGLTLASSYIIDFIMKILWKSTLFQKLEK